VNLGSTTGFRDRTTDNTNVIDIGSLLTSTFTSGWTDDANLTWGLFGVRNSSRLNGTIVDGDPAQTIYVSRAETTLGTQVTGWGVSPTISQGAHDTAASQIAGVQTEFLNAPAGTSAVLGDAATTYDANGATWGAFTSIGGTLGNFGTGTENTVLDLFRSLGRTQAGGTLRVGSYEGSFHINDSGVVGYSAAPEFAAIPEPSRALLLGLSGAGLLFRRRRSTQAA
jgi:hypothetical protein